MGLDFIIERKRKGEAYESDAWKDCVIGRNCHHVKELTLQNIGSYNKETFTADLNIGTLNKLLKVYADDIQSWNLNNEECFYDDNYTKTLNWMSELAQAIYEHAIDYEYEGVEYKYRLIDSF